MYRESNKSGFAPSPPPPPPPTLFTKRAPIVVPKSNHGNSLKCLYCHSTVTDGQVYCTACGVQLPRLPLPGEDPTRLNTCPECRSELSPSITVCHVCDTPLQCPQSLPTLIVQDACTNTKNIPVNIILIRYIDFGYDKLTVTLSLCYSSSLSWSLCVVTVVHTCTCIIYT